jgi:tetratricopeptide (TPR) repeat protein
MNFILFQIRRLFSLPMELLSSPTELVGSLWGESDRSRALLLGIPAILLSSLGVIFLLWAKFGLAGTLEDRYKANLEKSSKEKLELVDTLRREVRMQQATQLAGTQKAAIAKDDPRREELENWRSREKIYLEKLIDLNPEEAEYLYKLGLVSYENRDLSRCLALMNLTAPLDEPGYVDGHLWLARYYMNAPIKTTEMALRNINLAMAHADQCLKREQDNVLAKQIKGTLMFARNGDLNGAYDIFYDLFNDNPKYYRSLLEINKRLKKTERNDLVLGSAIAKFESLLRDDKLDSAERIQLWNNLTNCYTERKQFEVAEEKLLEEIKRQSELGEGSGRVWVERMLASVYVKWISEFDLSTDEGTQQQLAYLRTAFRLDPSNRTVMKQLTRLAADQNSDVAESAKLIYDASSDPDAPASVLNEIGVQALAKSDYGQALIFSDRAKKKSPKNPEILNNLAYTHTVGENPNPARGLTLIDQALRYLPKNEDSKSYLTYFRDTRGQALMQLNRWTDAIADFEYAHRGRPENRQIIESLIRCYQAVGLDDGQWVRKLEQLDAQDAPKTGS